MMPRNMSRSHLITGTTTGDNITFEEAEKLVENAWWREKKGE